MTDRDDDDHTTDPTAAYGIAALSLLDAIVLILQANGTLKSHEVDEAFDAAISAHTHRHEAHSEAEHQQAARILSRMRAEGNSLRLDL